MERDEETLLKDAIGVFGAEMQMTVAIEEMSELTKELCKEKRGIGNVEHIAEEIADVEIMLDQMKIIFACERNVKLQRISKLLRLAENIVKGE